MTIRDVAAAFDLLEENGSRYYKLTGNGTNIKFEPEEESSVQAALERLQRDLERLGPGVYTVEHRKNKTDTRNLSSFRIALSSAAVGGPGGDAPGVAALQIQIEQERHLRELDRIEQKHRDDLRDLREKHQRELDRLQPDGFTKIAGLLENPILQRLVMSSGGAAPPVAGLPRNSRPAPAGGADGQEDHELTDTVAETIAAVHEALGQDRERTLQTLRKLTHLANTNPAQLNQVVSFL